MTSKDTACANPAFNAGIDDRCNKLLPDESACSRRPTGLRQRGFYDGVDGDAVLGVELLIRRGRSEVIDPTPEIDPLVPGNELDLNMNFVFRDQDLIYRHRFIAGVKLQYYVVQLTLEAQFALKGTSLDDQQGTAEQCPPQSTVALCDARDTAASQRTLSLSAGVDF